MRGQFICKDGKTYRMPVHFREMDHNPSNRVVYQNVTGFSVEQKTDEKALARYVPAEFELTRPVLLWSYANCRDVDFMAHGEYRIFQVAAPVRYQRGGLALDGVYPLLILENNAIPILGGREEDGMPKLFCDIAGERHYGNHWFASAAHECSTLLRFDFHEAAPLKGDALEAMQAAPLVNSFGYRYLPQVGSAGAALSGPVLYPQENHTQAAWTGDMTIEVHPLQHWYENIQLFSSLKALQTLPALSFENALRTVGSLRLCVADSRAL